MTPAKVLTLAAPAARNPDTFVLPHSLDAEKSLLGAAILHAEAADYLSDKTRPEMFFRRAHQQIFAAIKALRDDKTAVDLITLKDQLGRMKKLDAVGGPAYLASLTDGVPRGTNVAHYAQIIKDLYAKRALAAQANRTLDLVAAGEFTAAELVVDADRRLMELQAGHVEGRMLSLRDTFSDLMADLEWRVGNRGKLSGVPTGFPSIDGLTLGWQPGDLVVIGARPSIGKTSMVMNGAVTAAQAGKRIAIFSLEMRRKQLEYRILSQLTGVPLAKILGGYLGESDWGKVSQAMGVMNDLQIEIDDRAGQTAVDIRAACRRMKADGGIDLAVVDYVQLMPGTLERRGANRNEEITDIAMRLKWLADEVSIPILLLSQLSRDSTKRVDPRPKLSDLRDSGSLEQHADIVGLLHRKNHREGGPTEFLLEKQRQGSTGVVILNFDRDTTTFTDAGVEIDTPAAPAKKAETLAPVERSRAV